MLPEKEPDRFRTASETLPRLALLGPIEVLARGAVVRLPPKALAVLVRLATSAGHPVALEQLYRDVWVPPNSHIGREERTSVHRQINELRHALHGNDAGAAASLIRMQRDGRVTTYRLLMEPDRIDAECFRRLVEQASESDAVTAARLLQEALDLWRGQPLLGVEHLPFARRAIDQLIGLRDAAARDLMEIYRNLGRPIEALAVGTRLATGRPDDTELGDLLSQLRVDLRRSRRGLVRRTFEGRSTAILTIVSGDILTEHDAHIVVGFADTFDTDTTGDVVISKNSLQAQVMRAVFGDDRALMERRLRAALRHGHRVATETRLTKKRGKLIRFAVGTVAVLHYANRRVFAVAYSRMGNDLVARSSLDDLCVSLERLWDAVYVHGQIQPVAIPLIGAGLARVDDVTRADLLKLVAASFVARSRRDHLTDDLRIVVRPADLADIDMADVASYLENL